MKTKLAVQVTSNSVATALEVCRILKVPDFEESEATVTFLRMFDRLFDFLNSKPCGKGFKGPVSLSNVEVWGPFIDHAKEYLLGLKIRNAYGILVQAMDHPLGTFVKGIFAGICCIEAIIYEYCGEGSQLRFIPGFKLGQDNLELYFGKIRARHGWNNNPTTSQLEHSVKALLCYQVKASWNGNCMPQEESVNKIAPTSSIRNLMGSDEDIDEELIEESDNEEEIPSVPMSSSTEAFVDAVVAYIAGFVGRSVSSNLRCGNCIAILIPEDIAATKQRPDFVLINERDNGGLFYPSGVLIQVCKVTERVIRSLKKKGLQDMDSKEVTRRTIQECLDEGLFCFLSHSSTDSNECCDNFDHGLELVSLISARYTKSRLRLITRNATLSMLPETNRNTCNKLVHFKGN